jgi:hypothetical protein
MSLETWFKRVVSRPPPPFLKEVFENYEADYGELWAITAAPSSPSLSAPRRRGVGKTVLSVKLLIHTYARVLGRVPTWEDIRRYIFYRPKEFVDLLLFLRDRKLRVPLAVWDDAGVWLFRSRAREKFVARVSESMEVIRTVIANLMFTTTSIGKLVRGVRESLTYVIAVSVVGHAKHADGTVIKKSRARLYYATEDYEWLFHRKSMPKPIGEWIFTVWLPDEIYHKYLEYRSAYTDVAAARIWKELEEIAESAEVEERGEAEAELEEAERGLAELATSADLSDLKREFGYG